MCMYVRPRPPFAQGALPVGVHRELQFVHRLSPCTALARRTEQRFERLAGATFFFGVEFCKRRGREVDLYVCSSAFADDCFGPA